MPVSRKERNTMFIAMNNFKVAPGREADFEERWRGRETYLNEVPGFVHFALLKGDEPGEYISHSTWVNRDAFVAWTKSEAFAAGHRQGNVAGIVDGPPHVKLYETVLEQQGAGAPV
jgi:heme-degrading monooxygenase HmoA